MREIKTKSIIILIILCFSNFIMLFNMGLIFNPNNSNTSFTNSENNNENDININIPTSSADDLEAGWWNSSWAFRIYVNISDSDYNHTHKFIPLSLNFTDFLANASQIGELDNNSIRLIEYNGDGDEIQEVPSIFVKDSGYNSITNALGVLYWVLNGTTPQGIERNFYVYFDTTENGLKEAPVYTTSLDFVKKPGLDYDYSLQNDDLRISAGIGSWGNYYNHIYEAAINTGSTYQDQQYSGVKWGWMLYSWSYGGASSTQFNTGTVMEVVHNNSIFMQVKMVFDYSTSFVYERYYTVNHLDDTVEIRHCLTPKQDISGGGSWNFASWWNPGRGDSSYTTPNSAYGLGGLNFSNPNVTLTGKYFDGNDDFTSDENPNTDITYMMATTPEIQEEAWFVQWEETAGYERGVGTIWSPSSLLSDFGTISAIGGQGFEGRNLYMRFNINAGLLSGNTYTFNEYGVLFNEKDGTYVKNRSKGLQHMPDINCGELEDSGKILKYHLKDIDDQPISGAFVTLINLTDPNKEEIYTGYTDSNGNVTIKGLNNVADYAVWSNYTVGNVNYTLVNTTVDLDLTGNLLYNYTEKMGNLTTTRFTVVNPLAQPGFQELENANLSIYHNISGELITYGLTDENGEISFKLPASEYNLSVVFQDRQRDLKIADSGSYFNIKNFTLNSLTEFGVKVSINEIATRISISEGDNEFTKTTWDHITSTSNPPYSISLYRNDSVKIVFEYEDISGAPEGISGAEIILWNLNKSSDNSPIDFNTLTSEGGGKYSVQLDTNNQSYVPGSYILFANITKISGNYQSGLIYTTINILNHTSKVEYVSSGSSIEANWNDNITVNVNYETILPEIYGVQPFMGSSLSYYVTSNSSINGTFIYTGTAGNYNAAFNTTHLDVGYYELQVNAHTGENITEASTTINFEVTGIPTNRSWTISDDYSVSSNSLKVAMRENVTFTINYTDADDNPIENALVMIDLYIDEDNSYVFDQAPYLTYAGGLYVLNFNSSDYIPSTSTLRVRCYKENYEEQNFDISLEIMDYWNTEIEIMTFPSFYPWSNNASFTLKYYCNDPVRLNWNLNGSIIHELDILVSQDGGNTYTSRINFDSTTENNLWGYDEIGNGRYSVWFLTSEVNVTADTTFLAEPNISVGVYRPAQHRQNVMIYPVGTFLGIFVDGQSSNQVTESFAIYLDKDYSIDLCLNVSDDRSILDENPIQDAQITYSIYNATDDSDILIGDTVLGSNTNSFGMLAFSGNAFILGVWKIKFIAELENYSTAEAEVTMTVNKKVISASYDTQISTPQNKPYTLEISLADASYDNIALSDVNVSFVFKGTTYNFDETTTPGKYSFIFTSEILETANEEELVTIVLTIVAENYTIAENVQIAVNVGLPVDPYIGIPIRYWIMIGLTVGAMISVYAVSKGVAYSRIPDIIKQIDSSIKSISKKRKIDAEKLRPSREDTIGETLSEYWEKLGIQYDIGKKTTSYAEPDSGGSSENEGDIGSEIKEKKGGL